MDTCPQCSQTHPQNTTCPAAFDETIAPESFSQTRRGHAADATLQQIPPRATLKGIGQDRQVPGALAPGMEVGGYLLEECLGRGGMGEVWRARQPAIKRVVAIKVLDARLAMDGGVVTRFLGEARAVNEIRHKNLVDIFSFGEIAESRRPYLVMEHLEGQTLTHRLKEGPLPLVEILPLLAQICEAMQAAHDQGIIHRDLKPDNLFLVGREGERPFVKILDFGIAKLRQAEGESLTQTGEVFGTPEYMAPEQCMGAKNVDARSDIYALGIVLYEMISGRTPFGEPGEKRGSVWMKHVTTEPPPLSRFTCGRALPPGLEGVMQKCLSKEPEHRYQRVKDLSLAFEEAIHQTPVETSGPDDSRAAFLAPGQPVQTEKLPKRPLPAPALKMSAPRSSRGTLALLGIGGVLVAAILFFAYQYVSPAEAGSPTLSIPPAPLVVERDQSAPKEANKARQETPGEESASFPSLPATEPTLPPQKTGATDKKTINPSSKTKIEPKTETKKAPDPEKKSGSGVDKKKVQEGTLDPWGQ